MLTSDASCTSTHPASQNPPCAVDPDIGGHPLVPEGRAPTTPKSGVAQTTRASTPSAVTPARSHALCAPPVDITALLSHAPAPLDHVLPGLLAGNVGMLAGPGGIGKTMLELQLAVALATGTPACGGLFSEFKLEPNPARIVLVVPEESLLVLQHRLHAIVHALHAHLTRSDAVLEVPSFTAHLNANLRLYPESSDGFALLNWSMERTEVFAHLVHACEGARLVVIDPLRQFHACDENDSAAMNAMVQTLRKLAQETGAAVVFAHHTNKTATYLGQGDGAGAARGSSALTDGVRWQLNLSRLSPEQAQQAGIDKDDLAHFVRLDVSKANYLPPQRPWILQRRSSGVLMLADSVPDDGCRTTGQLGRSRSRTQRVKATGGWQ